MTSYQRVQSDGDPAATHGDEFAAEVTDFRDLGRRTGVQMYQVTLDHSRFSPEQSSGLLIVTSRTGHVLELEVLSVEQDPEGRLWHTTERPLQPGVVLRGRLRVPGSPATSRSDGLL